MNAGRWIRQQVVSRRELIGKFGFELFIVFVGTTAAFALENMRQEQDEKAYRRKTIKALGPSISDVAAHGAEIDKIMSVQLDEFDTARSKSERPRLPVYIESGGERPPTRAWDAIVATGAAKALEPDLLWRLARFYNSLDSFGERYIRYNVVTETRVFGLKADHSDAYVDGTTELKSEFKAYVTQLRNLKKANLETVKEARALQIIIDKMPV